MSAFQNVDQVPFMTTQKSLAPQIKDLLSGLTEHGNQHLTEVETDLIQTNILLKEAIGKLSASFMAIHEAVTTQQKMLHTVLADCATSQQTMSELQTQSNRIDLHINAAVTGLQFQDMTNQLIGRMMRRIIGFRDVLSVVGIGSDSMPVEIDAHEMTVLLDKITETLKTQSTMLENELWKAVCQTHMESGDIELF
jgi:hypothetical protein